MLTVPSHLTDNSPPTNKIKLISSHCIIIAKPRQLSNISVTIFPKSSSLFTFRFHFYSTFTCSLNTIIATLVSLSRKSSLQTLSCYPILFMPWIGLVFSTANYMLIGIHDCTRHGQLRMPFVAIILFFFLSQDSLVLCVLTNIFIERIQLALLVYFRPPWWPCVFPYRTFSSLQCPMPVGNMSNYFLFMLLIISSLDMGC